MNKNEQIFKSIFGSAWEKLPAVFQKRYINRPYTNDVMSVEGKMDISFAKTMRFLLPFFRLLHILVPYEGNDIPVKVDFRSNINSNAIYLNRKFYFPGKQPYEFNSSMQIIKNNDVVEGMSFGIGWKTYYFYDGKKVVMEHEAYVLKVFGRYIPLPLEIFIGKGHAEEEAIDDNSFRITMTMSHPLLGLMYRYAGNFNITRLPS